jgi:hypothetical protein
MENHLRSIDAPDGGVESPTETPAEQSEPRVRERRIRPKLALPTDRMKKETGIQALRATVTGSRGGERGVGADDIGARIGISAATAGLNNAFFAEAGWIEKVGRGEYKPTQAAIDFVQKLGFNETEAATRLGTTMRQSWYFTELVPELQTGPVPMAMAVNILANASGAGAEYTQQLESVVDWLEYVGLVIVTDGYLQLGQRDIQDLQTDPGAPGAGGGDDGGEKGNVTDPAASEGAGTTTKTPRGGGGGQNAPVLLRLDFELSVTADDLARLAPEQITALFQAAGEVASIKAKLAAEND